MLAVLWASWALAGSFAADGPSWVYFADRGPDAPALAARAAELSPRALDRRRRVRGDGGLDVRDLPPMPAQVTAVLTTGATLRHSSRWLNAISVEATAAQRAAILALPGVVKIRPVARGRRTAERPGRVVAATGLGADYGLAYDQLNLLRIPALHGCGLTGAGMVIGVQDAGFSAEHAALAGVNVIAMRDFVNLDENVYNEDGEPAEQDDHGSMVLSLIVGNDAGRFLGAAPDAAVILSKTEDITVEATFEEDNWVAGLEWIEGEGADVFTSSIGYRDWYVDENLDGMTAAATLAAETAAAQGLIIVNAIGNDGPGATSLLAPADGPSVLAVGAVDLGGVVAGFSSRGPTADGRIKPDLVAPGVDVVVIDPADPNNYITGEGSSFAAPLAAAGALLLLQAHGDLDPAGMRALLQSAGSDAGAPNNDVGWGLPDLLAAAGERCAPEPDPFDTSSGDVPTDPGDPTADAGSSDTGEPAETPPQDGGCTCDTRPGAPSFMLLLALLLRRRTHPR